MSKLRRCCRGRRAAQYVLVRQQASGGPGCVQGEQRAGTVAVARRVWMRTQHDHRQASLHHQRRAQVVHLGEEGHGEQLLRGANDCFAVIVDAGELFQHRGTARKPPIARRREPRAALLKRLLTRRCITPPHPNSFQLVIERH